MTGFVDDKTVVKLSWEFEFYLKEHSVEKIIWYECS